MKNEDRPKNDEDPKNEEDAPKSDYFFTINLPVARSKGSADTLRYKGRKAGGMAAN